MASLRGKGYRRGLFDLKASLKNSRPKGRVDGVAAVVDAAAALPAKASPAS